ncbi:uncharacterized protein LOC111277765 [Durio zibethinus]|uniref:Uncharacterized protein LOC111277765 n=1 Tax=Durio zibethinus TaxID=66656 RepID=A0A6P5WV08_DURZI|nr:uncharacterized protein LOC111277765 [Durio zibethinus]XP_022719919.1 uncharacterized protein LOC111277765 [Durio zibethinus]
MWSMWTIGDSTMVLRQIVNCVASFDWKLMNVVVRTRMLYGARTLCKLQEVLSNRGKIHMRTRHRDAFCFLFFLPFLHLNCIHRCKECVIAEHSIEIEERPLAAGVPLYFRGYQPQQLQERMKTELHQPHSLNGGGLDYKFSAMVMRSIIRVRSNLCRRHFAASCSIKSIYYTIISSRLLSLVVHMNKVDSDTVIIHPRFMRIDEKGKVTSQP